MSRDRSRGAPGEQPQPTAQPATLRVPARDVVACRPADRTERDHVLQKLHHVTDVRCGQWLQGATDRDTLKRQPAQPVQAVLKAHRRAAVAELHRQPAVVGAEHHALAALAQRWIEDQFQMLTAARRILDLDRQQRRLP
ncbi:hypothetical protein [Micromonospora chersina]|uniref:hypothetical protein n=1 Tax=Micromonospora chersina TaxID=47854 RepID=UPI003718298B